MKQAFLIIAHNEFQILQLLVSALDDIGNDIYVHIDRKVDKLPELRTEKSGLFVLDKRIDVRWGNVSQIKAELLLWETALKNGPYAYYHLISGTHLPLRTAEEIQSFFNGAGGNLFSNLTECGDGYQETLKIRRINLFTRSYASKSRAVAAVSQWLWKAAIAIERTFGIRINKGLSLYWANNWCSLKEDAVEYLVTNRKPILKRYRWSFCGDEFFAPTELMNSPLAAEVKRCDQLLEGAIGRSNATFFTIDDDDRLLSSDCLFARKFNSANIEIAHCVLSRRND